MKGDIHMTACTCNSFSSSTTTSALTVSQTGAAPAVNITSNQTSQNAMVISTSTNNSSGLWSNCTSTGTGVAGSCSAAGGGGIGVWGNDGGGNINAGGLGVYATSNYGFAIRASCMDDAPTYSWAGYFDNRGDGGGIFIDALADGALALSVMGNTSLSGTCYVSGYLTKSGGGFLIDHPTDPANQMLNHCFVESPEMLNIYRGIATLDANGKANIQLPSYFTAANQDPMPTLTALEVSMPGLYATKVQNGSFSIGGGSVSGSVSWMMTGARADKWAQENHPGVEIKKTTEQQGKFLHPELFGGNKTDALNNPRKGH
jgi:hypothetical protein